MKNNNKKGENMNTKENEHLPASEEQKIIDFLDSVGCHKKEDEEDVKQGE